MPHNNHMLKAKAIFGPGETIGKVYLWMQTLFMDQVRQDEADDDIL